MNVSNYLGMLSQGLNLVQQQQNAMQQASRPVTNQVVDKARSILQGLFQQPQQMATGGAVGLSNPGRFVDYSGAPAMQNQMSAIPGASFANPISQMSGTPMSNTPNRQIGMQGLDFLLNPNNLRGDAFSQWNTKASEYNLPTNSTLAPEVRDFLGRAGVNVRGLTDPAYGGGDYTLTQQLSQLAQGPNLNGGEGMNPGDISTALRNQAQAIAYLGQLTGGNRQGSTDTSMDYMGGQKPRTDAYGRPLSGLEDGTETAMNYPGNWFNYGYGPEYNFMYTAGGFNPQVSSNYMAPQGYGYDFGGYSAPMNYFAPQDFGGWGNSWMQSMGFADGGKIKDRSKESPDYTAAPDIEQIKAGITEAVNKGDFETADQLDNLLQNRLQMQEDQFKNNNPMMPVPQNMMYDPTKAFPSNGGYADGGAMEPSTALMGATGGKDDVIPVMAAAGEHVIPAWAVAAAGDGNTEAGHRVIDQMVEQLREKHMNMATYNAS